jgi:hypothetical protein
MTSQVGRAYAIVLSAAAFFVSSSLIAARPFAPKAQDPRAVALAAREAQLQRDSVAVRRIVDRRWSDYRVALARRNGQIADARRAQAAAAAAAAAAPSVRVVSAPAVTASGSS